MQGIWWTICGVCASAVVVRQRSEERYLEPRYVGDPSETLRWHTWSVAQNSQWTSVFGRSRVVPLMYPVHAEYGGAVLDILEGIGVESWGTGPRMFDASCSAFPVLDGAVCQLVAYGLAPMPSGVRVLGTKPLRLLCQLMDLRPPSRRLRYEERIPDPSELMDELARQVQDKPDHLKDQARAALFQDSDGARAAIQTLFGVAVST